MAVLLSVLMPLKQLLHAHQALFLPLDLVIEPVQRLLHLFHAGRQLFRCSIRRSLRASTVSSPRWKRGHILDQRLDLHARARMHFISSIQLQDSSS